jgi:hypothetical protein
VFVLIFVCIDACEYLELISSKIIVKVIFVLCLSIADYMVKGTCPLFMSLLFISLSLYLLIKFVPAGYVCRKL